MAVDMTRTSDDTPLKVDERVLGYPDRQAGISWPLPVDVKLERFLTRARERGERTSRREIAAAIMAFAEYDDDGLDSLLRRYRVAMVGDVLEPADHTNVIPFAKHGPGPRRSR